MFAPVAASASVSVTEPVSAPVSALALELVFVLVFVLMGKIALVLVSGSVFELVIAFVVYCSC